MKKLLSFLIITITVLANFNLYAHKPPAKAIAIRLYVDSTKNGNGTSWADAYKTLGDALKFAANNTNISEIWVAKGTYYPTMNTVWDTNPTIARSKTFYVRSGLSVYGGFAGTEANLNERNITTNKTVLSGDLNNDDVMSFSSTDLSIQNTSENLPHVIVIHNPTNGGVTIDGFTIKGGYANGINGGQISVNGNTINPDLGGGIYAVNGTNTFANNTFTGNLSSLSGGAIYLENCTNSFTNNTFFRNKAFDTGGAIRATTATCTFSTNVFRENISVASGGAVNATNGNLTFTDNNFIANYADGSGGGAVRAISNGNQNYTFTGNIFYLNKARQYGGGAVLGGSTGTKTFTNNLFIENACPSGGAVRISNSATFTNNTFLKNASTGFATGGVYTEGTGTNTFTNNIFWKNTLNGESNIAKADFYNASTITNIFKNNLLQLTSQANYTIGNGNLLGAGSENNFFNQDPKFVAESNYTGADNLWRTQDDNLYLQAFSPLMNQGNNTAVSGITADITGTQRLIGSKVELGTYENLNFPANPTLNDEEVCAGTTITLSATCDAGSITWYDKDNATQLGIGSPFSQTITETKNFYVSCKIGMNESSRIATNVVVSIPTVVPSVALSDSVICQGASVTLKATPTNGGASPVYTWFKNGEDLGITTDSYTVTNAVTADKYEVKLTASDEICPLPKTSFAAKARVEANPIVELDTSLTVCERSKAILNLSGGVSYAWTGPSGFTSTQQSPIIDSIKLNQAGKYRVIVKNKYGCSTRDSITIRINPLSTISFTTDVTPIICKGQLVIATGSCSASTDIFRWETPAMANGALGSSNQRIISEAGSYKAFCETKEGCLNSKILIIAEGTDCNGQTFLKITPDKPAICPNGNITLTAEGCSGTVTWYGDATTKTGNSATFAPTKTTTYLAQCSTGGSGSVDVVVAPKDIVVASMISTGIQRIKASETIESDKKIGNPSITPTPNVAFEAGKSILLKPGFSTEPWSIFKAEIKTCN